MATSEIEKLERRYAENPHGLTFAPLAEVHRKNGDVTRALELLTAGLELHPNYIPASIVLGRCHQDLGNLPAAEEAFAHVLRLDDENVIALKSLADINERLERFDDAESWLRRLVSIDRSNDEALEQLRRLELAKNGGKPDKSSEAAAERGQAIEAAETVESEPVPERPKRPSAEVAALDLPPVDIAAMDIVPPTAEPVRSPESPPRGKQVHPEPIVLERTPELSELKSEKVPSITDAPVPEQADAVPPMAGLVSQEFEPPKERVPQPLEVLGIDVETSEEVVLEGSGGSEYRVPNAAEEFSDSISSRGEASRFEASGPVAEVPRTPLDTPPAPETRKAPSYTARQTKGQTVAEFFHTMLSARPPASDTARPILEGPPGGEGSQAKSEGLVSFDDFFGSKQEGAAEKAGEPGKDDLDQFHTWLQNLKR